MFNFLARAAVAAIIALLGILFVVSINGCTPKAPPLTKPGMSHSSQTTTVSTQTVEDKPVDHPFASGQAAVKTARDPLLIVAIVAAIALAGFVGLSFTPFSFIGKIGIPIAGSVAGLCFTGAIVLPFLPWVIGAVAVSLLGFFGYEFYRTKSVKGAIKAIEAEIVPAPTPAKPA